MIRPVKLLLAVSLGLCLRAGDAGVKLPAYKKTVLRNGLTVLFMEQPKVPLVNLHLTLRSGSTQDPQGKEGLASLTASLLRRGTKTRNADRIAESLDAMGATSNAFVSLDATDCTAEFMKKEAAEGLEVFADLVLNPAFPEAEVQKLRAQRIDAVRAAKDSAQGVLGAYHFAFQYGAHPYGRSANGDEKTLAGLTRQDVAAFHAAHYTPSNAILAVVGDFRTADMEKLVAERFGTWKGGSAPRAELPKPLPVKGRQLLLVDKPDATQTYFMLGNLGVDRSHPDRVPLQVVNVLFGERFTSMINTALRIKAGLTYGAQARFNMFQAPGPFAISSFTANATTGQALDLALATLRELREQGITEKDLASAKAYIKGTLPPAKLETGEQLANVLATLQLYRLPDGDVNDFYAKVDAMTLADARRVIQAYYPEKDLCFTLIGKASEIRPMVEKLAERITTRSIAAPGF